MDSPPSTSHQFKAAGQRKKLPGSGGMGSFQMEGEADDMDVHQGSLPVTRPDFLVHTTFFNNFQDDFDDDDLM
ncbi:hypothetical protein H257_13844 [Aphanomyces astaci]|uniref:Uncharacterized protein n=1 Tax=Aphanomyces astaci TaxID=112090 RepID=W4FTH0_APHAT|nr:hypothetical protein H257_13844 [Aphanomyces astaci]ETV70757.1 hypothetical protein H257_13844 [Aphanomyces astaci]RHY89692.1 hypothetical protein DYB35_004883 [Aphanomyces astaci]RQM19573.1 hypothetical protein B5M09_005488 [Aphanomyces astaci]|eukprot:XP_009839821.1 hypothetical protein H257_13844 [Aphanomyces astaci]